MEPLRFWTCIRCGYPYLDEPQECAVCGQDRAGIALERLPDGRPHLPSAQELESQVRWIQECLEFNIEQFPVSVRRNDLYEAYKCLDRTIRFGEWYQYARPHIPPRGRGGAALGASVLTGGLGIEDLIIAPAAAFIAGGISKRNASRDVDAVRSLVLEARHMAVGMLAEHADLRDSVGGEAELLARLLDLYYPDLAPRHRTVTYPTSIVGRQEWAANRVNWAETNLPSINEIAFELCLRLNWQTLRSALEAVGYRFPSVSSSNQDSSRQEALGVLGLSEGSSDEEIAAAFRDESRKYHPDVLGDVPDHIRALADERMKSITHAYAILTGRA